jgi:hypothetical protein
VPPQNPNDLLFCEPFPLDRPVLPQRARLYSIRIKPRGATSKWIAAKALLHEQRQAIHTFPHVGVATGDPDPRICKALMSVQKTRGRLIGGHFLKVSTQLL